MDSFLQISQPKFCTNFSSPPIRATFPADFILPHFVTRTISSKWDKRRNSSLRSFVQPLVSSFLLGSNILFSTLFSKTLSLCFSLNLRDHDSHLYKKQSNLKKNWRNYISIYFNLHILQILPRIFIYYKVLCIYVMNGLINRFQNNCHNLKYSKSLPFCFIPT